MPHFQALASLVVLYLQNYSYYSYVWPEYTGISTNLQIGLNTQKNLYLNQVTPKDYSPNFPTQRNPRIESFKLILGL